MGSHVDVAGNNVATAVAVDSREDVYVTTLDLVGGQSLVFRIAPSGAASIALDSSGDRMGNAFEVGTGLAVDSSG